MSAVGFMSGYQSASRSFWRQPPVLAVFAATLFNLALCFVNTMAGGVGNSAAIACEVVIILFVLVYTFPTVTYSRLLTIGAAVLFLITLAGIRALLGTGIDIKPVRDLLIPVAFFMLGAAAPDLRQADRIVKTIVTIVIAVGAFEYFFPDLFTRVFNVAGFYIERGVMAVTQAQQSSDLFVSGMRPEGASGGRGLFPVLGNHRVSSIFLEPISAGNFGIVVFVWALTRSLMERRLFWGLFVSAAVIIVMADSRFGANFCALVLVLALLPAAVRRVAVAALPAIAILGLLVLPGLLSTQYGIDNGFIGRIILSGAILERFDVLNWLGLSAPGFITSDSGYAYALGGFGIVGIALFWIALMLLKGADRPFYLIRDLAGAYFAVLLCISNSPFTIKTGALLWFLIGVVSQNRRVAVGARTTPVPGESERLRHPQFRHAGKAVR
jgi:putative polymerase